LLFWFQDEYDGDVSSREVYPNAPIVLAAIEVRHTPCEPLERNRQVQAVMLVQEVLPLPGEISMVALEVQAGPEGQQTQRQTIAAFPRWTSRDRRTALTMRQDAVVVETTDYGSYERVRGILSIALQARTLAGPPGGVERIGLRYVDEIRVPPENGSGRPSWKEWIDSTLLGPTHIGGDLGLTPAGGEGVAVFSGGNDSALVLRYGAQEDSVVQSTPQLRRSVHPPGPLFKLDIDSFWQANDEVPKFSSEQILARADALHEPVRGVFESLITERLREEVLRHG
jgi:uncharacterized protein (TIGR04255 family)